MVWLWILSGIIVGTVALYVAVLLIILKVCVQPPRTPLFVTPGLLGVPTETVAFRNESGLTLKAWWHENPGADTVVILAHGYFVNRSEPAPVVPSFFKLGCSCLCFDFRGHGGSEKAKVTIGLDEKEDVRAAVLYVREKVPGARIVLFGSSMGAAASAFAISDDPGLAEAIILDSPYAKLSEAILGWWNFMGGPRLRSFLRPILLLDRYVLGRSSSSVDVAAAMKGFSKPVLILHGENDRVASIEGARKIQAACGGKLVTFENCDHTEARYWQPQPYLTAIEAWMSEHELGTQSRIPEFAKP